MIMKGKNWRKEDKKTAWKGKKREKGRERRERRTGKYRRRLACSCANAL